MKDELGGGYKGEIKFGASAFLHRFGEVRPFLHAVAVEHVRQVDIG